MNRGGTKLDRRHRGSTVTGVPRARGSTFIARSCGAGPIAPRGRGPSGDTRPGERAGAGRRARDTNLGDERRITAALTMARRSVPTAAERAEPERIVVRHKLSYVTPITTIGRAPKARSVPIPFPRERGLLRLANDRPWFEGPWMPIVLSLVAAAVACALTWL